MKVRLMIEDDSGRTYSGEVALDSHGFAKKVQQKQPKTKQAPGGPKKPTEALQHLFEKGLFKAELSLGKVESELGKIDCNFPKASLAKALERADFLTRRGTRGNYRWIQRHKPGA